MAFTPSESSNSSTYQAPSQRAHSMIWQETFSTRLAKPWTAHKCRKEKGSGKGGPTEKGSNYPSLRRALLSPPGQPSRRQARNFVQIARRAKVKCLHMLWGVPTPPC